MIKVTWNLQFIIFDLKGSFVAQWSKALILTSQDYLPLTAKVVGSSSARSENFMWEKFQLLAEGRWFFLVFLHQ